MNWDALGAIGEIVGALAVVISLLYLALQIRNQNAESRAAASHDFAVGWREVATVFSDGELAELYIKANNDFDSRSDTERLRLVGALHGPVRLFEEAFQQHQEDRMEAATWGAINRQFSSLLGAPLYQRYWEMRRHYYRDDFQKYVDGMDLSEWNLE